MTKIGRMAGVGLFLGMVAARQVPPDEVAVVGRGGERGWMGEAGAPAGVDGVEEHGVPAAGPAGVRVHSQPEYRRDETPPARGE